MRDRGRMRLAGVTAALLALTAPVAAAQATEASPGLTEPEVFPPFDPDAALCTAPPGLTKSLGFAQDNRRKFIDSVGYGLSRAASDRGLAYDDVVAGNDSSVQAAQIQKFVDGRYGAVVTAPVDPQALAPTLQRQIWAGGYVGTVVPPPATTILNAPQYATGKALGDAAAAYIRGTLGGQAQVVLLTQDTLQFLAPRFVAIRDSLQQIPGVTVIADISPNPVNEDGGYATMKLILEAHPDIDVVLGADAVLLGALKALREADKARPDQYIGGIDGEPDAIAELKKPDSPYKTTIALSAPVFGYALGVNAADWLEGKSVPQAMDALPIALNKDNIAAFEADQANPAAVYADDARLGRYLKRYGNICYDTRDRYVNFPWSSEAK